VCRGVTGDRGQPTHDPDGQQQAARGDRGQTIGAVKMDWIRIFPPIPTTMPARYNTPTIRAVVR